MTRRLFSSPWKVHAIKTVVIKSQAKKQAFFPNKVVQEGSKFTCMPAGMSKQNWNHKLVKQLLQLSDLTGTEYKKKKI